MDSTRASGEHRFTFNGVQRPAVVRVSKTIMEGAGAMIAYGAKGELTQGCIDVKVAPPTYSWPRGNRRSCPYRRAETSVWKQPPTC